MKSACHVKRTGEELEAAQLQVPPPRKKRVNITLYKHNTKQADVGASGSSGGEGEGDGGYDATDVCVVGTCTTLEKEYLRCGVHVCVGCVVCARSVFFSELAILSHKEYLPLVTCMHNT